MTCVECSSWLAMEACGELTGELRQRVLAHMRGCRECQEDYRNIKNFIELLRPSEVPPEILKQTHDNVMAAIRRKRTLRCARRVATWASAVAAVVVAGVAIWHFRPGQEHVLPPAVTQIRAQSIVAEKPKSALALAWENAADASAAFRLINDTYEQARMCPAGGDFQEMIALCEHLRRKYPDSLESLDAMKLISRCYAEMGEWRLGQAAFWEYATALGDRAKQRVLMRRGTEDHADKECILVACRAVLAEARRLAGIKDYEGAGRYCEEVIRRYPGTAPAAEAQEALAQHSLSAGEPAIATQQFEKTIEQSPDSPEGKRARVSLPAALFNSGRKHEAAQSWMDYAAKATKDDDRACGLYNAAVLLAASGRERETADATKNLKEVVEKYPRSPYARSAQRMLATLPERHWGIRADDILNK